MEIIDMTACRTPEHPRKWRRPTPCPKCGQARPIIVQAGYCYHVDSLKHVATIWACVCPACRKRYGIIQTGRPNLNRALRNWNHWTTHMKKETQ